MAFKTSETMFFSHLPASRKTSCSDIYSDMKNSVEMYNFSSKLWYNARRVMINGEVTVYLQVILNGKHAEFSLRFHWPVKKIDMVNGVVLPRFKDDKQAADHNLFIMRERSRYNDIIFDYRYKKAFLDIDIFRKQVVLFDSKESFASFMERETKARYRRKQIGEKTYKNNRSTYKCMLDYDKEALFININAKWMKGWKQFCINKGYMPATTWQRVKEVKTYLKIAADEPTLRVDKKAIEFPNPAPISNTTFLNKDEVRRLLILHRSGNLTIIQHQVLKGFLFTIFTGLRISDLYRVDSTWTLSEGFLDFIPKKNFKKGKKLHVAIMPMAMKFVHHVTGKHFELPTEQAYNRILKEIARAAEINKNLTSHVGRHTYGYLYLTKTGSIKGLQEALGHSKIETTERYAHLDDEFRKQMVMDIQEDFDDLLPKKFDNDL